ncbi:hypothetical protein AB6A40_000720 [Gnathostoma spinigerum]|uniref:Uncharacterized protein n=1 Tax=Gnathostoma spinigerum TaxID=75299 RepID=A0ABD6E4Q6_9BILA
MNSSSSCYGNATEAEILAIKAYRAEKLARVTREYYGFMQLPLAAVSIVLTLFQGVVILKAIILRRVSRKSYVMILNRNIGDALCCTCVLIVSLCVILKEPDE